MEYFLYYYIMDTRIIEVRKNIVIANAFGAGGSSSFQSTINTVNFIPDEVIVKLIVYSSGGENFSTGIYTDMVSDYIGSFADPHFSSPNLTFSLRKPIFGQYNFQLLSPAGDAINRAGELYIHLEFVKYRSDLPDIKVF